eukprot:GHVQ01037952.1.p1 GENE.GHVQ01037952.1~~GHVQ01037952.1.p1  ORF type:complete len:615 (-),score=118.40 GHVQ01037952.1:685-2529(-)
MFGFSRKNKRAPVTRKSDDEEEEWQTAGRDEKEADSVSANASANDPIPNLSKSRGNRDDSRGRDLGEKMSGSEESGSEEDADLPGVGSADQTESPHSSGYHNSAALLAADRMAPRQRYNHRNNRHRQEQPARSDLQQSMHDSHDVDEDYEDINEEDNSDVSPSSYTSSPNVSPHHHALEPSLNSPRNRTSGMESHIATGSVSNRGGTRGFASNSTVRNVTSEGASHLSTGAAAGMSLYGKTAGGGSALSDLMCEDDDHEDSDSEEIPGGSETQRRAGAAGQEHSGAVPRRGGRTGPGRADTVESLVRSGVGVPGSARGMEGGGFVGCIGERGGEFDGSNDIDCSNLQVSNEVRELFVYVSRYKPHIVELETQLKPFMQDYVPSIGEVDAMIKIPRPDGKEDNIGLYQLDEPTVKASDPAVLNLQLRIRSKQSNMKPLKIESTPNAHQHKKEVNNWINSINQLHRSRPPAVVRFTRPMPEIETLMQEWPHELETHLMSLNKSIDRTTASVRGVTGEEGGETRKERCEEDNDSRAGGGPGDSDLIGRGGRGEVVNGGNVLRLKEMDSLSLEEMVKVVCVLLDIPFTQNNLKESLYLMWMLYLEFQDNQHFSNTTAI